MLLIWKRPRQLRSTGSWLSATATSATTSSTAHTGSDAEAVCVPLSAVVSTRNVWRRSFMPYVLRRI